MSSPLLRINIEIPMIKIISGSLLLLLAVTFSATAQTSYKLKFSYERGYEDNLYHSPETYIDANDDFFPSSQLLVDDMFNDYRWRLGAKHKFNKKNQLRLEYSSWLRRYENYKNANQSSHMLKSYFRHTFSKKINGTIYGRYQREDRIGTNVLGDELVLDFAFHQYYLRSYFNIKVNKKNRLNLEASYRYRDFDPVEERRSFSYGESRLRILDYHKYRIGNLANTFRTSVEWKDRPYIERLSRTSEGVKLPDNALRHDRYFEVEVSNKIYVRKKFTIEPKLEFDRRIDRFNNYFSFHQFSESLEIKYKRKKWEVAAQGEFSQRNYLVRLAPNGEANDPRLQYNFLRYRLEAGYHIMPGLTLATKFRRVNRDTNVMAESVRTRRPYNFSEISAGLYFDVTRLKTSFSKKDKE